MDIREHIRNAPEQAIREALELILSTYLTPAFGSLTKRETDILIFTALENLGYLPEDSSLYLLVHRLRVTRAKARNLLYDRELRRIDEQHLDHKLKDILKRPLIQKQGDLFVLEIENPLLIEHLKSKIQLLGYASDGSFSPSLVKLSDSAIIALLDSLLDKAHKDAATRALVKAGFPDKSFKGILKDVFKALAKKVADEAGSRVVEGVLSPLIDGAFDGIGKAVADYGLDVLVEAEQRGGAASG